MGKHICSCWATGNWSKLNCQIFNLCSYCKVDGLRAWIKAEFRFPSPPPVPKSQSWKHHQNYEARFCLQMWRAGETKMLNMSYNWGYLCNVQAKDPGAEGKVPSPIFTFKSQVGSSRTFVHPSSSPAFLLLCFQFLEWLRCEEMAQIKFRAIWHENPFWACRKNIQKMVKFYLAFFFFFSSILRKKSILWERWFYRNISRNCLKETEHIMHRTFSRHSQIYNIFNYKTQRDKKQEVCAKNSPFCSTNWQWKRLRE